MDASLEHSEVSQKAVEFAHQIRAAAARANNEEEIRIEVERQLAFVERQLEITLDGHHEYTVASGRIDSVYDRVIIEYKNPASTSNRIGPDTESAGTRKVVDQIKTRFKDLNQAQNHPVNSLLGIGLDGNRFVFVRHVKGKWKVEKPVEVNRYSAERFLWALINLGTKGKGFCQNSGSRVQLAPNLGLGTLSSYLAGGCFVPYRWPRSRLSAEF